MDELVTHADVARWLPTDVAKSLELAMDPKVRGWYTPDEASADGGRFVEVQTMSEVTPRLYRTGD